ncbi:MAG: hypothetical protein RLZZ226_1589 [Pseudomonadota bacterium]
MDITYQKDDDLDFLQYCTESDLKVLADILIYDEDKKERRTGELMKHEEFKSHNGKPDQYRLCWQL